MNRHLALTERILVCDGAMGTMLHAAGNSLDQALPALNLSNPGLVRSIHNSYVDAGTDIIQTNTFGASRLRLSQHGYGNQVEEINRAGVQIAREAARTERPVLVAGSISPAVTVQQRRQISEDERTTALHEQITVLAELGVDLLILETFGYLNELVEAIATVADISDTPIIAQATFSTDTLTLSGHTPREVANAVAELPITALGTNCTLGPQGSLAVLRELREHSDLPLTAQPNAGLPRRLAPARFEYDIDSEYFVRYIRQLLDAGATIVGGCCGTTPTQLAAAAQTAEQHRLQRQPHLTTAGQTTRPASQQTSATESSGATTPFMQPGHLVGVELTPALTGDVDDSLEAARQLGDAGIDLLSISAAHSNRAQVNTMNLALHLYQRVGLNTMANVPTWDRTIMALQADLLGAHALGLRRIVCETGTPPLLGDYPHVDGIWDVDSIGLIELLAGLNRGSDYYGLQLPSKTNFEIGARINPGSSQLEQAATRARDKIAAGAQFLITRPVYELTGLKRLLDAVDGHVPVLATVRPLTSVEEAEYLAHEVPDVTIPPATLDILERAGNSATQAGRELAAQLATQIKDLTKGIVITPSTDPVATVKQLVPGLESYRHDHLNRDTPYS